MDSVYAEAVRILEDGSAFALATVLAHKGSTPRSTGSKMIVLPDRIVGTIGGGGVEGEVIRIAREKVLPTGAPTAKTYDLTRKNSAGSFICGGMFEILTARIDATAENIALWAALRDAERSGDPAWLFILISEDEKGDLAAAFCVNAQGTLLGDAPDDGKLHAMMLESPDKVALHADGVTYRVNAEKVRALDSLILFGGGHVSLEVARLAVGLGFRVTVLDDREEFANTDRFPDCDAIVLDDYTAIPPLRTEGAYILVITRGHIHDQEALEWALEQPAAYVGMIGSKTKRDTMYKQMMSEGTTAEQLQAVYCPVGIDIGADTPMEIGVSIIAEVIAVQKGVITRHE